MCRLRPGQRLLDLACGKGELLCQWACRHGITGIGVDLSEVFLAAARARADELGVAGQVELVSGDAAGYRAEPGGFDVVSCLGATWIGDGLVGTLELMRPAVRADGLLLVGEPYWTGPPPPAAYHALGIAPDQCASLAGTLDRFAGAGLELVEMVLADGDSWDRYAAAQWWTIDRWLRAHPDHPDAPAMREFLSQARHAHLAYSRDFLGWGCSCCGRRRPNPPLHQTQGNNDSGRLALTMVKWRRSTVAISWTPSRSAHAITEASTLHRTPRRPGPRGTVAQLAHRGGCRAGRQPRLLLAWAR